MLAGPVLRQAAIIGEQAKHGRNVQGLAVWVGVLLMGSERDPGKRGEGSNRPLRPGQSGSELDDGELKEIELRK